jgi:hypothetical protein
MNGDQNNGGNGMPPYGPNGPGGPNMGGFGPYGPMMPYNPYAGPVVIRDVGRQDNNPMREPEAPPLRVRVALAFMGQLNTKAKLMIAANEHNIEAFAGLKVSPEEETARVDACTMLSKYFMGQMEPDHWEKTQFSATPVLEMGCPCIHRQQNHMPDEDCPFCAGTGKMEIAPKGLKRKLPNETETHEAVVQSPENLSANRQQPPQSPPPRRSPRSPQ